MSKLQTSALFVAFTLSSCATIMNKGPQVVQINSDKPADVEITNAAGVVVANLSAPGSVELSKSDAPYQVQVTAAGYDPQTVSLEKRLAGHFWGNLLFGGLIGMAVDYSTKTQWMLENDSVNIRFIEPIN